MGPSTDHLLHQLLHQALCVTDDALAVHAALGLILGVPAGAGLSWEPGSPALISTLLGPDSAGTIELEPLPAELGGRLVPGTTSISFAVDDLDERIAACRAANLDVTVGVGAGDLSYAVVAVAGLEFELLSTRNCRNPVRRTDDSACLSTTGGA